MGEGGNHTASVMQGLGPKVQVLDLDGVSARRSRLARGQGAADFNGLRLVRRPLCKMRAAVYDEERTEKERGTKERGTQPKCANIC